MRVLAFDVSVTGCSVCVLDTASGETFVNRVDTERGQAELLIPMIGETCRQASIEMKDISCIAVTRGPGSFTGVRIGLATARSLGLALNCPVFGFSTLDVMARGYVGAAPVLFLVDTKRGDYYGQVGEGNDPRIWSEEDVSTFDGEIVRDLIPDVRVLANMGLDLLGRGGQEQGATPLYLRGAEVSQPKSHPKCVVDMADY